MEPVVLNSEVPSSAASVSTSPSQHSGVPDTCSALASGTQTSSKEKKCKFFFSEKGCALGHSCKFSHDLTKDQPQRTTGVRSSSNSRPLCKFYAAGFCKWGTKCGFQHPRVAQKPSGHANKLEQQKLSEIKDNEIKSLRKTEIDQMKKRFPKRKDIDNKTFQIIFKTSDPDWPFDVKTVNLEFSFPDMYPRRILAVRIYDDGCLPPTLSRHLVKKMNDWLVETHEETLRRDKVYLVFRPFLKWLDKSLEQMFTDGLTMYKRELAAAAAGMTFVHHTELQAHYQSGSDESSEKGSEKGSDDENAMQNESLVAHIDDIVLNEKEEEVIPGDVSIEGNTKDPQTSQNNKLNPARRGTELRMKNLQLMDDTATLHISVLRIGLRCTRCKTVHHVSLHPEKPYVVVCDKCRSNMSLVFHSALMHMSSNTAGFFDLNGCQPFDLVLQDCQLVAGCLNCNRDNLVHGLLQDQPRSFWCITCHKKMSLSTEKGSFVTLNEGLAIKIGADAVVISKKAKPKSELRILAEGKPLPFTGTCGHYKKSYRWFRFPCCGKLYPCDKCHNEKEVDHEMEMANRMVCGFCSKEQGFSLTKPCSECDSSMTRAKSQHWEGGLGCRNKIHMAKGDKQKFAGSNKTISKKAESAQKKTGKKTTRVRHTS